MRFNIVIYLFEIVDGFAHSLSSFECVVSLSLNSIVMEFRNGKINFSLLLMLDGHKSRPLTTTINQQQNTVLTGRSDAV